MHDVFRVRVARPGAIDLTWRQGRAHRVHATYELAVGPQSFEYGGSHAGHDPRAGDDVWRVRQLHTDLRERRTDGAHAERNHVHRAARHRPAKPKPELGAHLVGVTPIVSGAGILGGLGADEGLFLDAGDVARIRARPEASPPR